jgi:hypothetical protein
MALSWQAVQFSLATWSNRCSKLVAAASSAAASGRSAHGTRRDQPTSKNSAITRPRPAIVCRAESSCHARDDRSSVLVLAGRHPPIKREPHTTYDRSEPLAANPPRRGRHVQPPRQRTDVVNTHRPAHADHFAAIAHPAQR